jgi:hypothetical protein
MTKASWRVILTYSAEMSQLRQERKRYTKRQEAKKPNPSANQHHTYSNKPIILEKLISIRSHNNKTSD